MSAEPIPDFPNVTRPASPANSRLDSPVFRTVTLSTGRKALRLEDVFWAALDDLAAERATSRNKVLDSIISDIGDADTNASSHIRAYLARHMRTKAREQGAMLAADPMIALMQQAPIPSYAMSRDKRLLKVNREFLRLLQLLAGNPRDGVALETTQLLLDTPLVEIFDILENDAHPHQCGVSIIVGSHRRRATTRVVRLPGHHVSAVVGYIIT